MDQALRVRVREPRQHLPHDGDGVVDRERACSATSGRRLVPGTYSIVRYGGSA